MKKDKKIVNIEEWIEIARKDWKRMKRSLRAVDAEAAGFFLQLGVLDLTCEDVKKDLKDVRKFIRTMFPDEKLDARK